MPVALAGLADVAYALMLLLLAAALTALIYLLVNSLGKAPVIGSWISGTLAGWLTDARNALLNAAKSAWHGLVNLLNWCNTLMLTMLVRASEFYTEASQAISRVVFVRLPELAGNVYSQALSLYDTAKAEIITAYNQAIGYATSVLHTAEQTAQVLTQEAISEGQALFARAEADTLALVGRAEADAANLVTQASTALQSDIASAEALAAHEVSALQASVQSAVNQLANDLTGGLASAEALAYSQVQALQQGIITDLETTGDAAVQLAWPDAVPDLQALRGVLGADFPWLNDLLGLMAGAGTAGLLGALIRSMATSQAVTRLATDCIVPNCRNLSGLGSLLQDLEGLLAGDLLFSLLAAAVADPQAAARDIEAALYQPAADTVSLISQLLGA